MKIERIGEFLVRKSNGKITKENIIDALMVQKEFPDYYKKIGEILVILDLISPEELQKYLNVFNDGKINQSKIGLVK